MQYKVEFLDNPPAYSITVEIDGESISSGLVPITEGTTREDIHKKGVELAVQLESKIAEKAAQEADSSARQAALGMLKDAFVSSDSVELDKEEVEAEKARIAVEETARLVALKEDVE